ncbi:MAG TPA: DJ-1/PfpI family protein, partial [Myxococcota bacterium]|nr:DJ-1/PfpI family protein [Myxococcota bacterium]
MGSPRTLGAVFYEGFELLDVYGPLEMFGSLGPELLRIVTIAEAPGPVASFQGPKTVAEHGFADAPPLDLILV